jgi:hypothetical protein
MLMDLDDDFFLLFLNIDDEESFADEKCTESQLSSSVEIKTIQNSDVDDSTAQSISSSDNGDHQISRSAEDLERMFQDFIQV